MKRTFFENAPAVSAVHSVLTNAAKTPACLLYEVRPPSSGNSFVGQHADARPAVQGGEGSSRVIVPKSAGTFGGAATRPLWDRIHEHVRDFTLSVAIGPWDFWSAFWSSRKSVLETEPALHLCSHECDYRVKIYLFLYKLCLPASVKSFDAIDSVTSLIP